MSKTSVEQHLTIIPEAWAQLKEHMENNVLPALKAGRALESEDVAGCRSADSILHHVSHLARLASAKRQSKLEGNPTGTPIQRSAVHEGAQEMVNDWLRDICDEHDIAESAWDGSHERFTFKHSFQALKIGEVEFSVPDRVKEMYEEISGNDFNDDLREMLVDDAHNLDIDYEYGDMYDSYDEYELD